MGSYVSDSRRLSFIENMSLGVLHRWKPESDLFVILTAYMDESGRHRGATITVMAGYVGYSGAWKKFEKKWGRMLKDSGLEYFHAVEAYQQTGICKGWKQPQTDVLFRKTEKISHAHSI